MGLQWSEVQILSPRPIHIFLHPLFAGVLLMGERIPGRSGELRLFSLNKRFRLCPSAKRISINGTRRLVA
jgi:hypothetical protein